MPELNCCANCEYCEIRDKSYYCTNYLSSNLNSELNSDSLYGRNELTNKCKYYEYSFMSAVAFLCPVIEPMFMDELKKEIV